MKLTSAAVFDTPPRLRRSADGGSVYQQHGAERFSTDEGPARELRVLTAARRLGGPKIDAALVETHLAAEATWLGDGQAAGARHILSSGVSWRRPPTQETSRRPDPRPGCWRGPEQDD